MVSFDHDDPGYLAWLRANPTGYVVNTYRPPNANYLKLHTANCHTIRHLYGAGATWTGSNYLKFCSANKRELARWASRTLSAQLSPCGACAP